MPTYDEVLNHVRTLWFGTRGLRNFLLAFVDGFPDDPWEIEDEKSMCMEIAWMLLTDNCDCGPHCHQKHNLNAWPQAEYSWQQYVYCAVIGPAGMCTNSIAEGMTYPFLNGLGIHARPVELKICHSKACGLLYEGGNCPYCGAHYSPYDTEVISQDWLVIEGDYLPVYRWKCIPGDRKPHYYNQERCVTQVDGDHTFVHHPHHISGDPDDGCDSCPWTGCPHGNPHHGQKATTLWTKWPGGAPPQAQLFPPPLIAGVSKGIKDALAGLSEALRKKIIAAFGDDPMTVALGLFADPQDILSVEQVDMVRGKIIRALKVEGVDAEVTEEWLCSAIELSSVQQVTGDEGGEDDGNQ